MQRKFQIKEDLKCQVAQIICIFKIVSLFSKAFCLKEEVHHSVDCMLYLNIQGLTLELPLTLQNTSVLP